MRYKNFTGKDGFVWWYGVVENVDDPEFLGRCKVRCIGYHPPRSKGTVSVSYTHLRAHET